MKPGAMTGLPGAMTGLPGAMTGFPGAMPGLPGAMTGLPGAMTGLEAPGAMIGPLFGINPPLEPWKSTKGVRVFIQYENICNHQK
jgi:hypothetical protein